MFWPNVCGHILLYDQYICDIRTIVDVIQMHVHEGGCWISPGLLQQVIVESKAEAQTSLPMLIQESYLLLMIETGHMCKCMFDI